MAKNELVINRGLKFGVEMEVKFSGTKSELAEIIKAKGVNVRQRWSGSTHTVLDEWKIVADGSVTNGWELVSPPMTDFKSLKLVCEALEEAGVTVDKQCGLHVHHDINDLEVGHIKNVYELYHKYELRVIHELLPMSRRHNGYCKPLTTVIEDVRNCQTITDLENHPNIGGGTYGGHYNSCRYKSLNFRAYRVYGTLEFRAHSGSVEFDKIRNWVLFTHKMIEVAKEKKVIKPVSEKRMVKWNEDVKHSSFDLYKELGISGTSLSTYLGSRRKALR